VPRGAYDDGGRSTVVADKAEATNYRLLLGSRVRSPGSERVGKGESNSSSVNRGDERK
jgi:hypothetical protein